MFCNSIFKLNTVHLVSVNLLCLFQVKQEFLMHKREDKLHIWTLKISKFLKDILNSI